MTRKSPIQTTPHSTKTQAFRGMSRQASRPGNPKKAQRQRVERWGEVPQHDLLQGACRRRAHALRGQTLPHCQRCLASHQRRHLGSRDGDCVWVAQSPRFLSSPAASFRFTELLWQHLKPIMSIEDLQVNLIEAKRLASEENDRILVWVGEQASPPATLPSLPPELAAPPTTAHEREPCPCLLL